MRMQDSGGSCFIQSKCISDLQLGESGRRSAAPCCVSVLRIQALFFGRIACQDKITSQTSNSSVKEDKITCGWSFLDEMISSVYR